jgi:hypothetical protein
VTRALYSLILGVFVMIALPVSQLRLATIRVECCCPDQDHCKCPDHGKHTPGQPTMQACHKKGEAIASADAPVFAPPAAVALEAPPVRIAIIETSLHDPHDAPSPARPPRPS